MDLAQFLVIAHVIVAIIVTIAILWLGYSERPHAIAQILLAWLVPFLGPIVVAVFVSVVHRNMTTPSEPLPPDHYDGANMAIDAKINGGPVDD